MRMMLISLIVIYSLALVARAADPDPETVDSGGCGSIYECYAPASCINIAERSKEFDKIKPVSVEEPIFKDCPAIIRFYKYNQFRVYVSIESLLDTSEISSIELLHNRFSSTGKATFSCKNNNGKMEGNAEETPPVPSDPLLIRTPKNMLDTPSNKIKCSFEVTKKSNAIVGTADDEISISVGTGPKDTTLTKKGFPFLSSIKCDPADFEFDIDDMHDKAKKYSEITYRPGDYFCEDEKYHIEYRLYKHDKYSKVEKNGIKCNNLKFEFDGEPTDDKGETIMIRCAIEIKFLCDYDVKEDASGKKPVKESPDPAAGKATSLKCPPATPHLMVSDNGRLKPIMNPVFKCEYYGGDPVWTVNGTDQLTKEGPPVYCTESLPCNVLNPISETKITMGFLSQADFLPRCHAEGTMWIGNNVVPSGDIQCKGMTGTYYYTAEKQEHAIDASTEFVCKYPAEKTVNVNEERTKDIGQGIGAAVGAIIGGVLLLATVVFVWTFFRVRKERRKKEAENHAAFMRYCAVGAELQAYQTDGKKATDKGPEPEQQWSAATTMMRYQAMAAIATEEEGDMPADVGLPAKVMKLKRRATGKMRVTIPAKPDDMRTLSDPRVHQIGNQVDSEIDDDSYKFMIIEGNTRNRKYKEMDPKKKRTPFVDMKKWWAKQKMKKKQQ